jgi:hypothetical protein
MKKKLAAITVLLFSSVVLAKTIPISSVDSLLDKKLSQKLPMVWSEMVFAKGKSYSLVLHTMGQKWRVEGSYELKKGKILLHPGACVDENNNSAMECNETIGEAVATLVTSDDDLYFSQILKVDPVKAKTLAENMTGFAFGIPDTKVPEGSRRTIDGIQVVTAGMKNGITTANAKIREKPSVESQSLQYCESPFGTSTLLDYVPAGTKLVVKARTIDKVAVNEWNNYWYYVDAGMMTYGVWMYGEFVKFDE